MKDWLKMHWIDSSMTQCRSYNCWWVWQSDQRYYQWRFIDVSNFHGVYCTKCGALRTLLIPCEQNANKCNYAYSECLEECYWEDHIVQSKCIKGPCEKSLDPFCAKCSQCEHTLSYPSGSKIHERGCHTYRAKLWEAFASTVLIFPTQVLDASKNTEILHIQVSSWNTAR